MKHPALEDLTKALLDLRAAFERHDLAPPAGLTFENRSEILGVLPLTGPTVAAVGETNDKFLGFRILPHRPARPETGTPGERKLDASNS